MRIAMDDFGTGYSSLSYLRSFPFDKIKIDRVVRQRHLRQRREEGRRSRDRRPGRYAGKTVIAEGIETDAELACLRLIGCEQGQGFLFSKARPQHEMLAFLNKRKPSKRVA